MELPRDALLALSAVIWADGDVTDEEARSLRAAARATGLTGADLEAVEAATERPVDPSTLDLEALSHEDRVLVYGLAAWLMAVDSELHPAEHVILHRLGRDLGLDDAARERGMGAAVALARVAADQGRASGVLDLLRSLHRAPLVARAPHPEA